MIKVANIDRFLQEFNRRMTAKTLASVVWVLRSFLRFLYASGLIPHNLATAVTAPRIRRGDTPPLGLPSSGVRRICGPSIGRCAPGDATTPCCC